MDRDNFRFKVILEAAENPKNEIEKILDSLLDFGDDARFFGLFRKLCRHVYTQHPDSAVEYVNIFRMMFGSDEN